MFVPEMAHLQYSTWLFVCVPACVFDQKCYKVLPLTMPERNVDLGNTTELPCKQEALHFPLPNKHTHRGVLRHSDN